MGNGLCHGCSNPRSEHGLVLELRSFATGAVALLATLLDEVISILLDLGRGHPVVPEAEELFPQHKRGLFVP